MMLALRRYASVLVLLLIAPVAVADVRLPHVFGDHMVMQRDVPLPVWGWAEPGEAVVVRLSESEAKATADARGQWRVKLDALPAGGPLEMTVSGKNTIRLSDVLVGEVWVCSGQSNMAFATSRAVDGAKETAAAAFPKIRLLTVPQKLSGEQETDANISWEVCSPESVGIFSAVAYFFGRELHNELHVPVGLIDTSWGGTAIEPWTPRDGFAGVPKVAHIAETIDKAREAFREHGPVSVQRSPATRPIGTRPAVSESVHPLLVQERRSPSAMYNAMVHPLVPFAIRGALWYQGEANTVAGDGMMYHEKMKALIGGWRAAWGQGEFPFYFVQLAPYTYRSRPSGDPERLPRIWEAQFATLALPNTGMAVTTDIGNVKDIHPTNKQEVGRRLALWALAGPYGRKDLVHSGPLYKSIGVDGDRIRVRFEHVGGGLASRDGEPLTFFQIAGEDRRFVDAEASIEGNELVVRSPEVKKPVAVRFGWNELAEPNLMNKEGLPASPFRSDRW